MTNELPENLKEKISIKIKNIRKNGKCTTLYADDYITRANRINCEMHEEEAGQIIGCATDIKHEIDDIFAEIKDIEDLIL